MVDSNNINVIREKTRKINPSQINANTKALEELNSLIGASDIPGTARTITGCLNQLSDRITALGG